MWTWLRTRCLVGRYGYGSYEISIDPSFSSTLLPLLDRGVVFVVAHVRGGGEMGRTWYESAKFGTKALTFTDFIACGRALVARGVTTPAQLTIEGRSAGGLLVGAVLNMAPDLFNGAIAGVPFVDVLTTMADASIPLTTGEWEEWGNPNVAADYETIKAYSPVDNVKPGVAYPAVLFTAGLHDPRVGYWVSRWSGTFALSHDDCWCGRELATLCACAWAGATAGMPFGMSECPCA